MQKDLQLRRPERRDVMWTAYKNRSGICGDTGAVYLAPDQELVTFVWFGYGAEMVPEVVLQVSAEEFLCIINTPEGAVDQLDVDKQDGRVIFGFPCLNLPSISVPLQELLTALQSASQVQLQANAATA